MKSFVVIASCVLAAVVVASVHSEAANGNCWDPAFAPGSPEVPQIVMAVACVDKGHCFLAGGQNGQGYGIYYYDGQINGQVSMMPMNNMSMMIMSVEAGGTAADPTGAAGGISTFFTPGMPAEHYFDSKAGTWQPSTVNALSLATVSTSISASKSGKFVVALDGGSPNGTLISTDGGATYNLKTIPGFPTPNMGNCTTANAVEVVDENTWYIIFGQEPQVPSASSSSAGSSGFGVASSARKALRKKHVEYTVDFSTGAPRVEAIQMNARGSHELKDGEYCDGYDYEIVKTTDGGATYTSLIQGANASFYFTDISCLDADHCAAVGGSAFDSVVYMTADGSTWKQVLQVSTNANGSAVFNQISYVNGTDIWIGGSEQNDAAQTATGLFYYSKDGGKTWFMYNHFEYAVAVVMSMSFPTSSVGFAVGINQDQSSAILKYAAQPYFGYFGQKQCFNNACDFLCQEAYFPQNMCIEGGSGSVIATCTPTGLVTKNYNTTSCVGAFTTSTAPINTCLQNANGGAPYFENLCNVEEVRKTTHQHSRVGTKFMAHHN